MLAGGDNPVYRATLQAPHSPLVRLEVWSQGVRIDSFGSSGVPFFDGSVSATLNSRVTRQLDFTTHRTLYPFANTDLLAPYGHEIRAFRGVTGSASPDIEFPVFCGRINTVSMADTGSVLVSCVDRAGDIQDAFFRIPENSQAGASIISEFRRLVSDALPSAVFGTSDFFAVNTPVLTWENDRASACDDLANAVGAFWYTLADGSFVMRQVPWTRTSAPIVVFYDGRNAPTSGNAGMVTNWSVAKSRDGVANVITLVGERADGTPPVHATVSDVDPDSPTYIGGPFGVKGRLFDTQAAQTQGQAEQLARSYLRQTKALADMWALTVIPDASLELGDPVAIRVDDFYAVQVISAYTIPLSADSLMDIQLRAQIPGPLED